MYKAFQALWILYFVDIQCLYTGYDVIIFCPYVNSNQKFKGSSYSPTNPGIKTNSSLVMLSSLSCSCNVYIIYTCSLSLYTKAAGSY